MNTRKAQRGPARAGEAGADPGVQQPGGRPGERILFILALIFLGLLLTVSAQSDVPAGDRVGRRLELLDLIAQQQQRTASLEAEAAELQSQVASYQAEAATGQGAAGELQAEIERLAIAAGLAPMAGPGITVTLTDSKLPLAAAESADVNDLVIHEQDLQGVVNALWSGGAEALSINGQRVLTTSAVRCVGNILLLNGRVHPPPYVIAAIGDPADLRNALDRDRAVATFRDAAARFELGYEVVASEEIVVPAFSGAPDLRVAEPVQPVGAL